MSSKKLKRLKLLPHVAEKLEKQNIHTCMDILSLTRVECLHLLNVSDKKREDLVQTVSKACCPPVRTAYDIYKEKTSDSSNRFLLTSLPALDSVLQGGLLAGSITEISGPPSVGKTQFCFLLSILATLPVSMGGLDGCVIYIDTESAFSAQRLKEIAESRFPELYGSETELARLMLSIYIYQATTTKALREITKQIEWDVIRKGVKLIILDSVASLLRKEYSSEGLMSIVERNNILVEQAAILKNIAETFGIVVFVTNQITTQIKQTNDLGLDEEEVIVEEETEDMMMEEPITQRSHVTPALGLTWSHCVSTRLVSQFVDACKRQLLIVKSPLSRNAAVYYTIEQSGIVLTDDRVEEIECVDPHLQHIRTKCHFLKQQAPDLLLFSL